MSVSADASSDLSASFVRMHKSLAVASWDERLSILAALCLNIAAMEVADQLPEGHTVRQRMMLAATFAVNKDSYSPPPWFRALAEEITPDLLALMRHAIEAHLVVFTEPDR